MEENISQKVRDRVTRFKKGDLFTVRDFEDLNNESGLLKQTHTDVCC